MSAPDLIHATCVSLDGRGVLLSGEAGSGKSDLALRLIDRGAQLVADDQVALALENERVMASAPERLCGLLEIRGIGIRTLPFIASVPIILAVRLVKQNEIERMPEAQFLSCLGQQVPLLSLHAFDASTDAKIRMICSS